MQFASQERIEIETISECDDELFKPEYLPFQIYPPAALSEYGTVAHPDISAAALFIRSGAIKLALGPLSPYEQSITVLTSLGMDIPAVSDFLYRSPRTIQRASTKVMEKMGAINPPHLVTQAFRQGVMEVEAPMRPLALSKNHIDVARLIGLGRIREEIGAVLGIKPSMVSDRIEEAQDIVGVKMPAGVVMALYASGLVSARAFRDNHIYTTETPDATPAAQRTPHRLRLVPPPTPLHHRPIVTPPEGMGSKDTTGVIMKDIVWLNGRLRVSGEEMFTAAQLSTLVHCALGFRRDEIATVTNCSTNMVDKRMRRIMKIMGIDSDNDKSVASRVLVMECFRKNILQVADHIDPLGFAPRELDCLKLLAEGYTNREIGEKLSLSEETVRCYVRNARVRSKSHSVVETLCKAVMSKEQAP